MLSGNVHEVVANFASVGLLTSSFPHHLQAMFLFWFSLHRFTLGLGERQVSARWKVLLGPGRWDQSPSV